MGLDTVELVMEFEDEFEITIPDDEAEMIQTVGQTVQYIVKVLAARYHAPVGPCRSAHRFYELRRGLTATFRVPRAQVRPSAEIGALVPAGAARARWGKFARALGLPRPPFSLYPTQRFPPPQTTVAALIRAGRGSNDYFDGNGVNDDAVWRKVRQIVSGQLGLAEHDVHWHSHYINDLNAN